MKLIEFANNLQLEVVAGSKDEIELNGVYIGDLLSVVMSKAKEKNVWITIQTHLNILAVAELLDISAIIIAENMEISSETIEKANEIGIPVLKTNSSAYEIASKLCDIGIK